MIERRKATAERGNAWVAQRIERNDFWSGVLEHCPDFESFVMEGTQRFDRLRRPQLDYLRDGDRQVDFIGRTESLAEDVTTVGERLGFDPELDQRNAGGGGDFRSHFTPAMRQRVADLFETDLRPSATPSSEQPPTVRAVGEPAGGFTQHIRRGERAQRVERCSRSERASRSSRG